MELELPDMASEGRDPATFALLDRVGVAEGMHVLEAGAGTGSVTAWLAERVGIDGRVMSTDIDLTFHAEMPPNVILRQHDITSDRLPAEHFDVVHARAVIQHCGDPAAVLGRLCRALKPGGAMVIEEDATLAQSREKGRDANAGVQVLGWMRDLAMEDLEVAEDVSTARPTEAAGEWIATVGRKPRS